MNFGYGNPYYDPFSNYGYNGYAYSPWGYYGGGYRGWGYPTQVIVVENGNYRGRGLVCPKPVIVWCRSDRSS